LTISQEEPKASIKLPKKEGTGDKEKIEV